MSRPLPFTDFCARVLGIRFTPAQRVLWSVFGDGVDPCDLEAGDRALACELFGAIDRIRPSARKVLALMKGARVGGTRFGITLGVYLSLTVDLSHLAPGEQAFVGITAPSKSLARQALRYAKGAFESVPSLKRLIEGTPSSDSFTIRRPDGGTVEFKILAASARGTEQRGAWFVYFQLTEASFMRDPDSGMVNDKDVFKAARPRVMPGGMMLLESTAWTEESLHFSLVDKNFGAPSTALAAKAPTLLLRGSDPNVREFVEQETERDPDNADREFNCKVLSGGSSVYFDHEAIKSAVNPDLDTPSTPPKGATVTAGGDFAFVSNASAFVAVHRVGSIITVADLVELQPGKGAPLKPSKVMGTFAKHCKSLGITAIVVDGHAREPMREHASDHKIELRTAPEGNTGKVAMFTATKEALNEGRLVLPDNPRLLRQLREVVKRPLPAGGVSITSPNRGRGGHGDLVSALVAAVHAVSKIHEYDGIRKGKPSNRVGMTGKRFVDTRSPGFPIRRPDGSVVMLGAKGRGRR